MKIKNLFISIFRLKKKDKLFCNKGKKICSVCGKPWKYKLEGGYRPDGTRWCRHDNGGGIGLHFTNYEKKMISKLPKGKVAVKGNDGVVRICDVVKNDNRRKQN